MPPPPPPPKSPPQYVYNKLIGNGSFHNVYEDENNPGLVVRVLRPEKAPNIEPEIDERDWKASPELKRALFNNALFTTDMYGHPRALMESDLIELKNIIITGTVGFSMAVYIQSMRIKMRQVLNSPIRQLLPTTVTQYNDFGMQSVTRCARLEPGGKIENLSGGDSTQITDYEMSDMAADFLAILELELTENGTRPAFFDGKMANLGVEILSSDEKVLRIIDVDPDADTTTVNCFTPAVFREVDATDYQGFIKYQSIFSVIAAFVQWMIPTALSNKQMLQNLHYANRGTIDPKWGIRYKLKPRLGWLRFWINVVSSPPQLWPQTTEFLNSAIEDLNNIQFRNIPDSARATFTDLAA